MLRKILTIYDFERPFLEVKRFRVKIYSNFPHLYQTSNIDELNRNKELIFHRLCNLQSIDYFHRDLDLDKTPSHFYKNHQLGIRALHGLTHKNCCASCRWVQSRISYSKIEDKRIL